MNRYDAVVRGGTVVTGAGAVAATIGITNGKIAGVLVHGETVDAALIIDATGKIILPGLIDAHVHFREPGLAHKEGFASGTMAAAAGGVTTVMVQPTDDPITATPRDFEEKVALAEGHAYVDYALQVCVGEDLSHVESLARLGAISFEMFLADPGPPYRIPDNDALLLALKCVARVGGVAGVNPSDESVVAGSTARIQTTGARDPAAFACSRPAVAEAFGVARACVAAQETGVRLHLRQLSCGASVDLLHDARGRCPELSAEVCPHYLLLSEADLLRQGHLAKMTPPLRQPADGERLWRALLDRTIDIIATDHAPHLPEEKEAARDDMWRVPNGIPGVQTWLPLMLEQVARGRLSLADVVRTCSEAPARLFGLYPRKGCLQPDADADLVIVDPDRTMTISEEEQFSRARRTPFAGWTVRGVPILTMLRGRVVMCNGTIDGGPAGTLVLPLR